MSRPAPTLNDPETVERLCAEYLPLARRMAQSFRRACWDHLGDEFESAALLALFHAAQTWDRSRAPFSAYAEYKVRYALQETWRTLRRERAPKWAILPRDRRYEPVWAIDSVDAFEGMLRRLTVPQRRLLERVFRDGQSFRAAWRAERMGYTTAKMLWRQALDQLHEHLRPQS